MSSIVERPLAAESSPPRNTPAAGARWSRRLGAAAFIFFLVKGLAWLIVPAVVAFAASR